MPVIFAAQYPVFAAADAVFCKMVRTPDLEPPVFAPLLIDFLHGAAEIQRFQNRFFHQCCTARCFHHRCCDIAGSNNRVLRRCGCVHQVGFIEASFIQFAGFRFTHQNLRCLRNAGQQFVCGLGRENHRLFCARTVFTDCVHVFVEVMESCVRQPCFVKVQGIDFPIQLVFNRFDVVQHAVVSRLCDGQNTWFFVFGFACKRVRFDFATDAFHRKLFQRNRADNAQMITGWHQENRNRTAHDDGVQNRFMAVTVDNNNIARRNSRVPDHFVRSGRAVSHKVAVVCIKNTCSITLRSRNRTGMIQQLTQFFHRVTNVSAQHVFTEELVEHLADRRFQERYATGVTRAVP